MRALTRRKTNVYTITDASRPLSEDVDERQRRYLISMSIRTACLVLAVLLWGHIHPVFSALLLVGAILLPYTSVVFANGGRKPPPRAKLSGPSGFSGPRALPSSRQVGAASGEAAREPDSGPHSETTP